LLTLLARAHEEIRADAAVAQRAQELQALGFRPVDALHLACAEAGSADVFLSTDDSLVRRAGRLSGQLRVAVKNPVDWLTEVEER
jgi:hypothetical protein